ncbi:MAG: hypothetical protein JKY24_08495 [Pseudomonadales bacterium]|nr:hypothetical protein [Pseudomonadales bacterium]
MQFICDKHRREFLSEPTAALESWEQWMHLGVKAFEREEWDSAILLLGCCYEASEWLLSQPELHEPDADNSLNAIDRFMVSGHQLAESYGRKGEYRLELKFLLRVHDYLNSLSRYPQHSLHHNIFHLPLKYSLEICQIMLDRYYKQRGDFDEYCHCLEQTFHSIEKLRYQLN